MDVTRPRPTIAALGAACAMIFLIVGAANAADRAVTIDGFAFKPDSVTVTVGDTVTWTNQDGVPHTATADDGAWNAGSIAGDGGTASVTFSAAGTFAYHCNFHGGMSGSIVVEAAAGSQPATDVAPASDPTRPASAGALLLGLLAALGLAALGASFALDVRRPGR